MDYSSVSNAIQAETITLNACAKHFNVLNYGLRKIKAIKEGRLEEELAEQEKCTAAYNAGRTEWCREFFRTNFPRLTQCRLGKILMGVELPEDSPYYFTTKPF